MIGAPRSPVERGQLPQWVADGGSLLLVADRGSSAALSELAAAFDVGFLDAPDAAGRFRTADQTLRPHAVVRGRHAKESASSVTVFAALAMRIHPIAEPLLVTADRSVLAAVMPAGNVRLASLSSFIAFCISRSSWVAATRFSMSSRATRRDRQVDRRVA